MKADGAGQLRWTSTPPAGRHSTAERLKLIKGKPKSRVRSRSGFTIPQITIESAVGIRPGRLRPASLPVAQAAMIGAPAVQRDS
jgi:hypothetical protein